MSMSLISICGGPRCFVWAVSRPPKGKYRRSSRFTIGNSEYDLIFSLEDENYRLTINCTAGCSEYVHITVDVEDRKRNPLFLSSSATGWCQSKLIVWNQEESAIFKSVPDFCRDGLLVFTVTVITNEVAFETPAAKPEPLENKKPVVLKKKDKACQTSSYMDSLPCLGGLSNDLHKLMEQLPGYQDQEPDIVLVCGNQRFKAHKNILSSRSRVLAAMFQNDRIEGATGIVELRDLDASVLEPFLRYLYSGTLPDDLTADMAVLLYKAADKYVVKYLSRRCALFLEQDLDPENACEMLALADVHLDREFREKVIGYILEKEIPLQDDLWLSYCLKQPFLALEVAKLFVMRRKRYSV